MTWADDPAALLERVVDSYWSTAARHAWQQYQQRGRGAIVFFLSSLESQHSEPLRYLTFSGEEQEIAQSSMAKLHELVQAYDPREEVVIAVVLPDEGTVFDVFGREPTPEAAAGTSSPKTD